MVCCVIFSVSCMGCVMFYFVNFSVSYMLLTSCMFLNHYYYYYYYYYYYRRLLSQAFLPGTSLEPMVIPTAQASSFTLQYFP